MPEEKQTILIVDDEPLNIEILSQTLSVGYRILIAKNGLQAIFRLKKNNVDLILLDIIMPEMNGHEVCRLIKANENTKHIPIIFITSMSDSEDEAKGLQLGAVDYITKPFYLPIVNSRVKTHLDLKLKTDMLEQLVSLDGLTNISNRRRFDEKMQEEWNRSKRKKAPLSLLMIDVDCFKNFNDHYGHSAGDDCLRQIASVLRTTFTRAGDLVARYGGEEFMVILPEIDGTGLENMAAELARNVVALKVPHQKSVAAEFVTISIGGVTSIPDQSCSGPQELVEAADTMLYKAKADGRNCIRTVVM
ncbi:MAG: diguanylate cyclase [Candidatus Wallbacteria bacterium]|nr:diguanylate cyclase [Candidatus Wallbacteria bacterium]